ncbi:hypothetical protein Scep_005575 [Stephania cephalantha]|uniref:Transcription factor DIVARICATA n=1 Tax=Stephania cephalantha TaxID=152367 RepID=A0AAP0KUU9_9MAGN
MFKWGMEILSHQMPHHSSNLAWPLDDTKSGGSSRWTHEENKRFEEALAIYDKDTPDRWQKVADMIPGKSVGDVMRQYSELESDIANIEAGLIQIPGYATSSFTLDWVSNRAFSQSYDSCGKRSSSGRPCEQERKKGVPWTEDEHRLFLMGLKKYGKGDWRNISRNFVITRTPTQVASHAQKYFIRQLSGGKDKRRSSIHDITTVNLTDTRPPSPENNRPPLEHPSALQRQPNLGGGNKTLFDWNQPRDGSTMVFNQAHGNLYVPPFYGVNSYVDMKLQGQNLHKGTFYGSQIASHGAVFQTQPSQCRPHG